MRKKGFTLIELMVAMGLFATVITVVTSLFLQSSKAERVVARRAAAIDNVSLVMEQMAREVRTGFAFPSVSGNGPQPLDELRFTNYKGEIVVYRLKNDAIEKSVANGSPLRLTSEQVKISFLKFLLMQRSGGKNFTPRLTISAKAEGPFQSSFYLQTTVSSRLIYYRP